MGLKRDEIKLTDLKEQHRQYAEVIGAENLISLAKIYGGTNIYIPQLSELLKNQKYSCIIKEYSGDNVKELARKYNVSERTVYRLVKNIIRKAKTKPFESQITLFDKNN